MPYSSLICTKFGIFTIFLKKNVIIKYSLLSFEEDEEFT